MTKEKTETWDEEIPTKYVLTPGHYELEIIGLNYVASPFVDQVTKKARMTLQVETKEGTFRTGAWDVINYLRENKPVIGKTFSFNVTGEGTGRRFKNLALK